MSRPLSLCRCQRPAGREQCPRLITQEDLLCDGCRKGCVHVVWNFQGESHDMPHTEFTTEVQWELA